MNEELYAQLEGDEKALVDAMASVVEEYGLLGGPNSTVYVEYTDGSDNEDAGIGVRCGNCVFHQMAEDGIECTLIDAEIQEGGICRLSMIPPGLVMSPGSMDSEDSDSSDSSNDVMGESRRLLPLTVKEAAAGYKVPAGVQSAAQRALKWIADGKAGDGFTATGRRRASQLAAGGTVSRDTVVRMKSYFARHGVDKQATGFSAGEEGYPSPGRVAWDAWGGDAGRTWVNRLSLD
jgi:hypothetical protein